MTTSITQSPSQITQTVPITPATIPNSEKLILGWYQKLRQCSTAQVEGVADTGKVLQQAKSELKGRWVEFKKSKDSPYTPRKVEMLMRIAANPVLSDAQHFAHFPE